MILASIDLGSNSVILLIMEYNPATQNIIKFSDYYSTPRISENLTMNEGISAHRIKWWQKLIKQNIG